jgi:tetratricopeptide (TPR) repeat protein
MIEPRPQPVGIYPFPAAALLLPAVAGQDCGEASIALAALLAGYLDGELPEEWEFFRQAALGNVAEARRLLDAAETKTADAILNRFILSPSPASLESARKSLSGPRRELLEVAAWTCGLAQNLPTDFTVDGELRAFCLAAVAAAAVEQGDTGEARQILKSAINQTQTASPVLAATLLSQRADLAAADPDATPAGALQDYREAIRLAADCRLPLLLAELYLRLGSCLQDAAGGNRGELLEAVHCYQAALHHGINESSCPERFAELQNHLGLAYLSMPAAGASHQLRTGIAVQSFRHALKVYTRETHPEMWARVSMNLANALQYAPSSHPEDNLVQAVETYEQVLQVRQRAADPVAYAVVILNQANALAHLGIFGPALEKLAEACKLFHWYEETEKAEAARQLVQQINERMAESAVEPGPGSAHTAPNSAT